MKKNILCAVFVVASCLMASNTALANGDKVFWYGAGTKCAIGSSLDKRAKLALVHPFVKKCLAIKGLTETFSVECLGEHWVNNGGIFLIITASGLRFCVKLGRWKEILYSQAIEFALSQKENPDAIKKMLVYPRYAQAINSHDGAFYASRLFHLPETIPDVGPSKDGAAYFSVHGHGAWRAIN